MPKCGNGLSRGIGIELSFTEIQVVDWPRAVRWYVEILGLRPVLEDVGHQFALLEAGVNRLALKGGKRREETASDVRLVFRVRDVDAERHRLIALGIDVEPARDHQAEAYREP